MESIDIEEMDCDTCLKMQEILRDEIQDTELLNFAVENISELFGYLATGRVNIRICKAITGLSPMPQHLAFSRKAGLNGSVPREPRLSPPRCKEALGAGSVKKYYAYL